MFVTPRQILPNKILLQYTVMQSGGWTIRACTCIKVRIISELCPPQAPIFWIKYGLRSQGREAEAQSQDFAFRALERIPQPEREGVRIPEVYRIFTDDYYPSEDSMVYIVMEYVPGKTLLQILDETPSETPSQRLEHLYDHIAKAIRLFLSFEVPYDATPGPYGGGIIRHPLFKDYEASIE
jgi:hypothetical protein